MSNNLPIEILGDNPTNVLLGNTYTELDAKNSTNYVSTVDTAAIGVYSVTYSNDSYSVIRTVNVVSLDSLVPYISPEIANSGFVVTGSSSNYNDYKTDSAIAAGGYDAFKTINSFWKNWGYSRITGLPEGFQAFNPAFGGQTRESVYLGSTTIPGSWLKTKLNKKIIIRSISMGYINNQAPLSFDIYASNTDKDYVKIYSKSDHVWVFPYDSKYNETFYINNNYAYKYYVIQILKCTIGVNQLTMTNVKINGYEFNDNNKIKLLGDNPMHILLNNTFLDPGYIIDEAGYAIENITNNINLQSVGEYEVKYNLSNNLYAIRKVIVSNSLPIIILGNNPTNLLSPSSNYFENQNNSSYIELGAINSDSFINNGNNIIYSNGGFTAVRAVNIVSELSEYKSSNSIIAASDTNGVINNNSWISGNSYSSTTGQPNETISFNPINGQNYNGIPGSWLKMKLNGKKIIKKITLPSSLVEFDLYGSNTDSNYEQIYARSCNTRSIDNFWPKKVIPTINEDFKFKNTNPYKYYVLHILKSTIGQPNVTIPSFTLHGVTPINEPKIKLLGDITMYTLLNSKYVEPGYLVDEGTVVTVNSYSLDITKIGSYQIIYTAMESNIKTIVVRTVIVRNSLPIEIIGNNPMNILVGENYTELGALNSLNSVKSGNNVTYSNADFTAVRVVNELIELSEYSSPLNLRHNDSTISASNENSSLYKIFDGNSNSSWSSQNTTFSLSNGDPTNLNTFNSTTGKSGGLNSINGPWIKIKLDKQQHINYYKILSDENTFINYVDIYGSNTDQNYVKISSKYGDVQDIVLQNLVFYKNYVLHIKGIRADGGNNLVKLKLFQLGYKKAVTTVYNETLDIVGGEKMASNKDGRVLASCKLSEKNINIYTHKNSLWAKKITIVVNNPTFLIGEINLNNKGDILAISDKNNSDILIYRAIKNDLTEWSTPYILSLSKLTTIVTNSLSGDGSTLAVTFLDHTVKLYYFRQFGNTWVSKCPNVMLKSLDYINSNQTISLSYLGDILAVGEPYNSLPLKNMCGSISFYKYNGIAYEPHGDTIYGDEFDYLGTVIDISYDGNTLIAGTPNTLGLSIPNGKSIKECGKVCIYKYNDNTWLKNKIFYGTDGKDDNLGYSVSISGDGKSVAFSSDCGKDPETNILNGAVISYKYINSSWVKSVNSIYGKTGEKLGRKIRLNYDGGLISIGGEKIKIFELINNIWNQNISNLPTPIEYNNSALKPICDASNYDGDNIVMSGSGLVVATGRSDNVKIFKWNGRNWDLRYTKIPSYDNFSFGYHISLNYEGNVLAIASPYDNNKKGTIEIIKYIDNTWTNYGNKIVGPAENYYIGKCELNNEGNTIAVTSIINNSLTKQYGVKVHSIENSIWVEKDTIPFKFENITNVSEYSLLIPNMRFSNNSLVIAESGEFLNNKNLVGTVNVMKYNGIKYEKYGDSIYGDNSYDLLGNSVDISSDGNTLVVSVCNTNLLVTGKSTNSCGKVKIYKYNNNNWVPNGMIEGEDGKNYNMGYSVSISGDGNRVALSRDCHKIVEEHTYEKNGWVGVYEYKNNNWGVLGNEIIGEYDQFLGRSLKLNYNGSIVACGTLPGRNINNINDACFRVFQIDNDNWIQNIKIYINFAADYDYATNSYTLPLNGGIIIPTVQQDFSLSMETLVTNSLGDYNINFYIKNINLSLITTKNVNIYVRKNPEITFPENYNSIILVDTLPSFPLVENEYKVELKEEFINSIGDQIVTFVAYHKRNLNIKTEVKKNIRVVELPFLNIPTAYEINNTIYLNVGEDIIKPSTREGNTVEIISVPVFNKNISGIYSITFNAFDNINTYIKNSLQKTFEVVPPPVITLKGIQDEIIIQGAPYIDPGYINNDNNINVTLNLNNLDTNIPGKKVIEYIANFKDKVNIIAVYQRSIFVINPLVIDNLININIPLNHVFNEPLYAQGVEVNKQVNTSIAQTNTIIYSKNTDRTTTFFQRTVTPIATNLILPPSTVTHLALNETYNPPQNYPTSPQPIITGNVFTSVAGYYIVTYTYKDTNNNDVSFQRIVIVSANSSDNDKPALLPPNETVQNIPKPLDTLLVAEGVSNENLYNHLYPKFQTHYLQYF